MTKWIHPSWMLVGLAGGVIGGTVWLWVAKIDFFDSLLWMVVVGLVVLVSVFYPKKWMLGLVVVTGVVLALGRGSGEIKGQKIWNEWIGKTIVVEGVVASDVSERRSGQVVKLKSLKINGQNIAGNLSIQLLSAPKIKRSDRLKIQGKVAEGFLVGVANIKQVKILEQSRAQMGDVWLDMRDSFAEQVQKQVGSPEAELGLAYLAGMKNGLDDQLNEKLRIVGLSHVVVASGTHLSILVGFARKIFGKISRFAGVFGALLLIFSFGSIIGWTASITRAALVSSLTILMWYVGRKWQPFRLIILVMAATLLIEPGYVMELGWQLSFGSFGGIMLLMPVMVRWLYGRRKPGLIANLLLATTAATVMCLPILIYTFGTISLLAWPANLLILPTIPWAMGLTFGAGLVEWCTPVGWVLGKFTELVLQYHLVVIDFLSQQEMFLIDVGAENPWVFLLYVPIVAWLVWDGLKVKQDIGVGRDNGTE